jgi:hypothetical protein
MSAISFRRSFAVWVMCLLALAVNAFGQTPGTGAISGVVYDPSNRVIANAEVLAVNEATQHVALSQSPRRKASFACRCCRREATR